MNVNVRRAVRMGIAGLALALVAVGLAGGQVRLVHSENIWAIPTTDALAAPGAPVLNAAGVYVAPVLDARPAATVLLALHGQSGTGPAIAARLRECAQRHL